MRRIIRSLGTILGLSTVPVVLFAASCGQQAEGEIAPGSAEETAGEAQEAQTLSGTGKPAGAVTCTVDPTTCRAALIATSGSNTMGVQAGGRVWAWGDNDSGQLGDSTFKDRTSPVTVIGPNLKGTLDGIVAVSVNAVAHSMALKSDGTVWGWGINSHGQIGDGTTTNRMAPVKVVSLSDVVAIRAGVQHSVALKADGSVWTWGNNDRGQLGMGAYGLKGTSPGKVPSGLSGVIAIGTGDDHTLAVNADGSIWAWGSNNHGSLGDGTAQNQFSPVQVTGPGDVIAVTGGSDHSIALKADGTVLTWGWNFYGQLGTGQMMPDAVVPTPVTGLTDVVAISSGGLHCMVLKADGTVWTWGWNPYGELGDGTTTTRYTPVQVLGLTDVVAIAAGGQTSMALKSDGSIWGWGSNSSGQIGNGTIIPQFVPVQVVGLNLAAPASNCVGGGLPTCVSGSKLCVQPNMAADGTACNDNDACTQTDTCQAGVCTGASPVVCQPIDSCHIASCDSSTGACANFFKANGKPCDDGNPCTKTDTCQAGVCTGASPVVCAAVDSCHMDGTCDPGTGQCSSPVKPDGALCNDHNGCTLADSCQAAACVAGPPKVCAAPECQVATCSAMDGQCVNTPVPDGTPCNGGACKAGSCDSAGAGGGGGSGSQGSGASGNQGSGGSGNQGSGGSGSQGSGGSGNQGSGGGSGNQGGSGVVGGNVRQDRGCSYATGDHGTNAPWLAALGALLLLGRRRRRSRDAAEEAQPS